jgi:hypothetical protein
MPYTCLYVPWVILVYSWKSPFQTTADINFCDEAGIFGAPRTAVCVPLWPGCTGRAPPIASKISLVQSIWRRASWLLA